MKKYIPFVIAFALFMENLDSTIITTAIPRMAASLVINPINLKIALTSYLLSLAIFIPISGWFADRFGTKKIFMIAIFIFILGSLCCGVALNLDFLVLSRILQGIGGALMMPVGRLILLKTFPKSELLKVTGYVTMPALIAPALGPAVGGLIVSYISWRWIFLVNLPFGILGICFASKMIPNYLNENVHPLDFIGFISFGIGLAGFAFGLESVDESNLPVIVVWLIILISVSILVLYFLRSRSLKFPFIDLMLFKIRTFRIMVLGGFLSRCSLGGIPFLLPLLFQLGLHRSPVYSGLMFLPFALGLLMAKFLVRPLLKAYGFKKLLISNAILLSACVSMFLLINTSLPLLVLMLILFIYGLLASMQFSCLNVLVYVDLTEHNISMGTSIVSTLQQLSLSVGIAIAAISLKIFLGSSANPFDIPVSVFHEVFSVFAGMAILTLFIFVFLDKHDGVEASRHQPKTKAKTLVSL